MSPAEWSGRIPRRGAHRLNLSRLQAGPLLSILVVLASIAAVGVFLVQHSFSLYDDAYIYFRYVESSFAGCALRY